MKDYREIDYCINDIESANRKILNGAYNAEDISDGLTPRELAAMWNVIEDCYDYCEIEASPEESIIYLYIKETLLNAVALSDSEDAKYSRYHISVLFDYWKDLNRVITLREAC